jgi:HD-like signal output (HDOD) protein
MTGMVDDIGIMGMLLKLDELDGLGDVALLDLARNARIERLARGEILPADEHLERHVFLIEGEVKLIADGKVMDTVSAGTARAKRSLFRVHTHGLQAQCTRKAALLSLDEVTYGRYVSSIKSQEDTGITVEDFVPDDQEASLIQDIASAFHHKEVDLPSLPEVAGRIYHALDDDSIPVEQVANVLQGDPAIAARVIQVANSALYGNNNVTSVRDAVMRIGTRAARAIVMSVVVKNLYSPRGENIKKRMKRFYLHSIRVGAIAHALARHLNRFDPDMAFLCGLIHDIGVIPLLIQVDRRDEFNANPALLETVLKELSHTAGAMLLEQWQFESTLITVSRESERWDREVEQADYCDLIQVAQLHCAMVGGMTLDAPPLNRLPAFQRLDMATINPLEVVNEAKHDVKELIALLSN